MNTTVTMEKPWPQVHPATSLKETCKYVTKNSQLGDGQFSVVKECMNVQTRDRYAMKLVHKNTIKGKLWLIQREVTLLKKVSNRIRQLEHAHSTTRDTFEGHHHVLQLFDFFETPKNIVLVTQLCSSGDLYDKVIQAGSLDVASQVKPYTACLLSALDFLHENGVVHRDIKSENVLFRLRVRGDEEKPAKFANYDHTAHDLILADFGLATELTARDDELREYVGTLSYIAPEIVRCKGIEKLPPSEGRCVPPYGTSVDIWALGVLSYFMMTGYMPFDCETDDETRKCIKDGDYYIDEELHSDPKPEVQHFWNFILSCFTVDSSKRPLAKDLKSHPFVREYFHRTGNQESFPGDMQMKRSRSSSSIHSIGPPSRSTSSSSIISLGRVDSRPVSRVNSRERNLNKIRETLKKTLSMTSISRSTDFNSHSSENKVFSTFKLDPQPPTNCLMNGCFSLTPESRSNFNTSPALSRNNSTNDVRLITPTDEGVADLTRQTTVSNPCSSQSIPLHTTTAPKLVTTPKMKHHATFDIMMGEDEDDEDEVI